VPVKSNVAVPEKLTFVTLGKAVVPGCTFNVPELIVVFPRYALLPLSTSVLERSATVNAP
jgi:hypothetical protein